MHVGKINQNSEAHLKERRSPLPRFDFRDAFPPFDSHQKPQTCLDEHQPQICNIPSEYSGQKLLCNTIAFHTSDSREKTLSLFTNDLPARHLSLASPVRHFCNLPSSS